MENSSVKSYLPPQSLIYEFSSWEQVCHNTSPGSGEIEYIEYDKWY